MRTALKTALTVAALAVGLAALAACALVAWFRDPTPYTPVCPRCDVRHAFSENGCFV